MWREEHGSRGGKEQWSQRGPETSMTNERWSEAMQRLREVAESVTRGQSPHAAHATRQALFRMASAPSSPPCRLLIIYLPPSFPHCAIEPSTHLTAQGAGSHPGHEGASQTLTGLRLCCRNRVLVQWAWGQSGEENKELSSMVLLKCSLKTHRP